MKKWRVGLLLSFVICCLWGEIANLKSALIAIEKADQDGAALSKQLADAMMPLANPDRVPSREVVEDFAKEFTAGVAGWKLTDAQLSGMRTAIIEIMKGSTTNLNSSSHLRNALEGLDVDSLEMLDITMKFVAIGEEVRGPDDLRLTKLQ